MMSKQPITDYNIALSEIRMSGRHHGLTHEEIDVAQKAAELEAYTSSDPFIDIFKRHVDVMIEAKNDSHKG